MKSEEIGKEESIMLMDPASPFSSSSSRFFNGLSVSRLKQIFFYVRCIGLKDLNGGSRSMMSSPVKKTKEKLNNFQQAILIQLFAVPQNL